MLKTYMQKIDVLVKKKKKKKKKKSRIGPKVNEKWRANSSYLTMIDF